MRTLFRPRNIVIAIVGLFVVIQLYPTWLAQTNPPVLQEPVWNSPSTRALAERACFDCHSNETAWPLYGRVAPVSWLVTRDVVEGRQKLNFSEWNRRQKDADEAPETIRKGEMPMAIYLPLHPAANLSDDEKKQLSAGLEATIAANPPGGIASIGGEDGEGGEAKEDH